MVERERERRILYVLTLTLTCVLGGVKAMVLQKREEQEIARGNQQQESREAQLTTRKQRGSINNK